MYIYYKLGTAT